MVSQNKPTLSLHVHAKNQKIYIPFSFSSCFKIINHVYERWFLNTILKEPDGFSKYVKLLINFRGRFDCSFWECCLLYFVVTCFAVDIMSSEMLNLVTDSPSIASLQVMILAKDSSRSKFGLKQVLFFLTSEKYTFCLGVGMRNNEN